MSKFEQKRNWYSSLITPHSPSSVVRCLRERHELVLRVPNHLDPPPAISNAHSAPGRRLPSSPTPRPHSLGVISHAGCDEEHVGGTELVAVHEVEVGRCK